MDMNQPLFPAPPGYIVDVANPQRDGEAANFWVGVIGMILAALFLSIRLYTKIVLARNFSADDGKFGTAKQVEIQPDMYTGALVVAWVSRINLDSLQRRASLILCFGYRAFL